MNLIFLTLAPLSSCAGHLARLSGELEHLTKLNKINIVCLGKYCDDDQTRNKYKDISFFHFPAEFNGWNVVNISKIIEYILNLIEEKDPDLVILQMEVWDLMRELGEILKGKVAFATVVHAVPFLGTPVNPSGKFKKDIIEHINKKIEKYRKDYITSHYKEVYSVFKNVFIIANNKTVAYYLKKYFKDLRFLTFESMVCIKNNKVTIHDEDLVYDFVYMARMETGKGIEYLEEILTRISLLLSRKINIAIMGRPDDVLSKRIIDELLQKNNNYFKIDYYGWADENIKSSVLSQTGVFIYPSFYDTYAIVLYEALSFGLPSVTWDVPFSRINYSSTNAVIRVPLFDFSQFAKSAVEMLKNRKIYIPEAINFINSFDSPARIARLDTNIYKKILNI